MAYESVHETERTMLVVTWRRRTCPVEVGLQMRSNWTYLKFHLKCAERTVAHVRQVVHGREATAIATCSRDRTASRRKPAQTDDPIPSGGGEACSGRVEAAEHCGHKRGRRHCNSPASARRVKEAAFASTCSARQARGVWRQHASGICERKKMRSHRKGW